MGIVTGTGKRGYAKYGCPNHRNRGTCDNAVMVRYERLEAQMLSGIEERLNDPKLVRKAVDGLMKRMEEHLRQQRSKAADPACIETAADLTAQLAGSQRRSPPWATARSCSRS